MSATSATLWLERPMRERLQAAAGLRDRSIESLGLGTRLQHVLERSDDYDDVVALVLAGEELRALPGVGSMSLVQIDEALGPFFDGREAPVEPPAPETAAAQRAEADWLAAQRALRDRPDLRDASLYDLLWPKELIALLELKTAGSLAALPEDEARRLWRYLAFLPEMQQELLEGCRAALDLGRDLGDEDWAALWRQRGVDVLPTQPPPEGEPHLPRAIEESLRSLVLRHLGVRYWSVLERRFGLRGSERRTLEQIGEEFGVTREWVRQLEARVLGLVEAWLDDPDAQSAPARLHPAVRRAVEALDALLVGIRRAPVSAARLREACAEILRVEDGHELHLVQLVAEIRAVGPLELAASPWRLDPVWTVRDEAEGQELASFLLKLDGLLTTEIVEARSAETLTEEWNARFAEERALGVEEMHEMLALLSSVERLEDGRYRGRLYALGSRALQAERVLREAGEPLRLQVILEAVNAAAAAAGGRVIGRQGLCEQLTPSPRIAAIARTGYWVLTDWPDVATGTIVEVMEHCLREEGRPMTLEELHDCVTTLRPAKPTSIYTFALEKDRFVRVDDGRWWLKGEPL